MDGASADGVGLVSVLPRKRMAATVLFTDRVGRVLVVDPTYKPLWELPGGVVEAGESPWLAAAREIGEELGLTFRPGRLLAVDYVPATAERTEGMITVFDGGVLAADTVVRLPAEELREYAFVEPGRLEQYLPSLLARRAVAALIARVQNSTVYLENGQLIEVESSTSVS